MIRQLARSYLSPEHKQRAYDVATDLGVVSWPTKGYEVWLVLQTMLFLTRPRRLLEFGSGRSTNFLVEYAMKCDARLLSIEQSWIYARKLNWAMKAMFVPQPPIRHVPLRDGWYDRDRLAQELDRFGAFDFLFIDGPVERGDVRRDNHDAYDEVMVRTGRLVMALVDDVNRPQNDALAGKLARHFGMRRFTMADTHKDGNALTFMLPEEQAGLVDELPPGLRRLLAEGGMPEAAG